MYAGSKAFYHTVDLTSQAAGNIFRSLFCGLTLRYRKTIRYKYSAVAGIMYKTSWSRELKKWIASTLLSFSLIALAMVGLYQLFQQDRCLDSGGRWLVAIKGCDSGTYEDYYLVITPTALIALVIIWVVLSWLISLIYSKVFKSNVRT